MQHITLNATEGTPSRARRGFPSEWLQGCSHGRTCTHCQTRVRTNALACSMLICCCRLPVCNLPDCHRRRALSTALFVGIPLGTNRTTRRASTAPDRTLGCRSFRCPLGACPHSGPNISTQAVTALVACPDRTRSGRATVGRDSCRAL